MELDPRNFSTLRQIALSYQLLGRFPEEDRALAIVPDNRRNAGRSRTRNSSGKETRGRSIRRLMQSSRKGREPSPAPRKPGSFVL